MASREAIALEDFEERILSFLVDLPRAFEPHSGATLFEHLVGTYRLLQSWDYEESVCLAGLFHSVYGTRAHPDALLGRSDRRLRHLIGEEAETLVAQFSVARWDSGMTSCNDKLAAIAVANLVEQLPRLAPPSAHFAHFLRLEAALKPEAARALRSGIGCRPADQDLQ